VNAYAKDVQVPQEHVKDGQIVLNISPAAVHDLQMNNQAVDFSGRFAGIPTPVYVPIEAVMGIYARENGQGMIFETEKPLPEPPSDVSESGSHGSKIKSAAPKTRSRPSLRVVK
jgi:stringent starvation protein B